MADWDDILNQFNKKFEENSRKQNSDSEYIHTYAILLLKITANFISLGRELCRTHENKELGYEIEKWFFDDQLEHYIQDLTIAIFGTKSTEAKPEYLRFILARLATYPLFLTTVFEDKKDPDSVNPNLIEDDLIIRTKNKYEEMGHLL